MTSVCNVCGHSSMPNGECSNFRCDRYPTSEKGITLSEVLSSPEPGLFDNRKWGNWTFKADSLELVHSPTRYRINLEEMDDSAQMLDWIIQIEQKSWATYKDLADLLMAFDDIFEPQANLCSRGVSKVIDATSFLRSRIGSAPHV